MLCLFLATTASIAGQPVVDMAGGLPADVSPENLRRLTYFLGRERPPNAGAGKPEDAQPSISTVNTQMNFPILISDPVTGNSPEGKRDTDKLADSQLSFDTPLTAQNSKSMQTNEQQLGVSGMLTDDSTPYTTSGPVSNVPMAVTRERLDEVTTPKTRSGSTMSPATDILNTHNSATDSTVFNMFTVNRLRQSTKINSSHRESTTSKSTSTIPATTNYLNKLNVVTPKTIASVMPAKTYHEQNRPVYLSMDQLKEIFRRAIEMLLSRPSFPLHTSIIPIRQRLPPRFASLQRAPPRRASLQRVPGRGQMRRPCWANNQLCNSNMRLPMPVYRGFIRREFTGNIDM